MRKSYFISVILIICCFTLCESSLAVNALFKYPYYLYDSYNPDEGPWMGMDPDGHWPVRVFPEQLLVGEPPALNVSGVTLPQDHWVEMFFRGEIVDGSGKDFFLVELDPMGEESLIFLTDGTGPEYLLGLASVLNTGEHAPTTLGFDIAGVSLPFKPRAVRILGIDFGGGSPGFDLAYMLARTLTNCRNIACNPSPPDGVLNVPIDAVLNWTPGCNATKHVVYFGDSPAGVDVNAAPVEIPQQPQDVNSFDPTLLALNKTYYWRVDELDENSGDTHTGEIWKFTTKSHVVFDDFESYTFTNIHENWSTVPEADLELIEYTTHNSSAQSLSINYFCNENYYTEVKRSFDSPQDWTSIAAKMLELYFYGNRYNDLRSRMFLTLNDGNSEEIIPYDGQADDIAKDIWQLWRVDLQNVNNVNLGHIVSLAIGFDNSGYLPGSSSGFGSVFIDDIQLYGSRCFEENMPKADFNGDCRVDFKDLKEMTDNWLDYGNKTFEILAPRQPLVMYQFDGTADDSIGGLDGQIEGNPVFVPGVHGQAIKFDGYGDAVLVLNAAAVFSEINTGITIAFWANGTSSPHHTDTLFCTNYLYNSYNPTISINLGLWRQPGRYNWDCGFPWSFENRLSGKHRYSAEWEGRWNHWAFTKDAANGKMQIFLNGLPYDRRDGSNLPVSDVTSFQIGFGWYGGYDGMIDEFRIYNYALSQPEIAYIVTNGTGIFENPLLTPADLLADNVIDFKDFAFFADSWLEQQLYPR
ncbi:MAG: LamG domain-containing protein [Sedimentisphaerales bacterium]|nr:LamG domain-containing protein [Sedimentisphaerales bacterium]